MKIYEGGGGKRFFLQNKTPFHNYNTYTYITNNTCCIIIIFIIILY